MNKKAITTSTIKAMKQQGEPITMVTAYDVAMARNVNEAGVEMILVGDSVGNVMLGYGSTVPDNDGRDASSIPSSDARLRAGTGCR